MTREEAIQILKAIIVYDCYPKSAGEETKEAIDMAIEALSNQQKWIDEELQNYLIENADLVTCKHCKHRFYDEPNEVYMCDRHEYGESFGDDDFCSWAKMKGGDTE